MLITFTFLQILEHEQAYLDALPSAEMYEKSFMHRDTLTDVTVAQDQDFLITASIDGHLKFWKKTPTGIEFAKHYRAHVGSVDGECCSPLPLRWSRVLWSLV